MLPKPLKKGILAGEVRRPRKKDASYKSVFKKANQRIRELELHIKETYDKFYDIHGIAKYIISGLQKRTNSYESANVKVQYIVIFIN